MLKNPELKSKIKSFSPHKAEGAMILKLEKNIFIFPILAPDSQNLFIFVATLKIKNIKASSFNTARKISLNFNTASSI